MYTAPPLSPKNSSSSIGEMVLMLLSGLVGTTVLNMTKVGFWHSELSAVWTLLIE